MRHYRDIIWKMTKGNMFLDEKKLRIKEALIPQDQAAREKVWPLIQKARHDKRKIRLGSRAHTHLSKNE